MLTKIEIQGYQNHPDTTLEFVSGTNVIIGPSDAGKSAIFRAIQWAITNRPLGDSFRSEWGGDTRVALHTSEGDVIERVKTPSRNEYVLNGQSLKAFGSGVPEEVSAALRIDSANIQSQMDMPFLLADSPGEAARALNQAASIDEIDQAISALRKSYSGTERIIKDREQQVEQCREDIRQYDNLPAQEEKLEAAERMSNEVTQRQEQLTTLTRLRERGEGIHQELGMIVADAALPLLETAEAGSSSLSTRRKNLDALQKLTDHAGDVRQQLDQIAPDAVFEALEQADIRRRTWDKAKQSVDDLSRLVGSIRQTEADIASKTKVLEALESEYHGLAPEECPLCGGVLNA